jgi:SAM-dependent methyltransferase
LTSPSDHSREAKTTEALGRDIEGYSDLYEAHYGTGFSLERVLIEARRRIILAAMARHGSRSILEIGCGLEPLFTFVDDFDAFTVVEPSHRFVEHARQLAAADKRVTIVEGFVEEVGPHLAGASFDLVVVSSLLHEVPKPDALLTRIRTLCGPSTVVHLNVPNVRSFHRLLALEMGMIESVFSRSQTEARFDRHTRFDMESLRVMLEAHDFEILDSGTYFIKPFTNEQIEAAVDRSAIDSTVVHALERMVKYLPEMGAEMYVEARAGTTAS